MNMYTQIHANVHNMQEQNTVSTVEFQQNEQAQDLQEGRRQTEHTPESILHVNAPPGMYT